MSTSPSTVVLGSNDSSQLHGSSDQNLSSSTPLAPAPTPVPLVDPIPPEYAVFVDEINEALAPAPSMLSSSTNIAGGGPVNFAAATSDSPSPEPASTVSPLC